MFTFLKRSYPLSCDTKTSVRLSACIAVFVFLFLLLFQPFGLGDDKTKIKYLLISGYAVATFLVIMANLLCVPRILKNIFVEDRWTVQREIIWNLWIVFTVGIGIYLFIWILDIFFDYFGLGFRVFFLFELMTFVIAIFPIAAIAVLKEYRLLKKSMEAASQVSAVLHGSRAAADEEGRAGDTGKITLFSEGGTRRYTFDIHALIYISAEGNYVNVVLKGNKLECIMIRNTLKNIEDQLKGYPFCFRCHRAFIVNVRKVKETEGNAQGIRLTLEGVDRKITVSRSYYKDFKRIMGIA